MLQSQISQENNFLGVPVASCRLLKSFSVSLQKLDGRALPGSAIRSLLWDCQQSHINAPFQSLTAIDNRISFFVINIFFYLPKFSRCCFGRIFQQFLYFLVDFFHVIFLPSRNFSRNSFQSCSLNVFVSITLPSFKLS